MSDPDEEDDDEDRDEDEIELSYEECGQRHDGGCDHAGSEYCDFECPYRDVTR